MLCSTRLDVLKEIRWFWTLAYLFCTCWFVYQLVQILPDYIAPTLTNTEVEEVPLSSMDFPLDIKICFQSARFNERVLKSFGYEDMFSYAIGWSNYNDPHTFIGWGGNLSSRAKDAGEILHAARYDWTKGCPKKLFFPA